MGIARLLRRQIGRGIRVMRRKIAAQEARRPGELLPSVLLKAMDRRAARDRDPYRPCECGSGKKAKWCCGR